MKPKFTVRRVYEKDFPQGEFRVLVDRLWPRGISKEAAQISLWEKDITPSAELRQAYHHAQISYEDFAQRYRQELLQNDENVQNFLQKISQHPAVTLVTAVKDIAHSHIPVLLSALEA
uniref:DUF488 domain-containing protein n=1 Tax=Ornithobacterium rhinotracheale TaxID=28251 RepID=UPI0039A5DE3B